MEIIQAFSSDALNVADDDRLWRYMKLTTFFWLARGTIFIPSLKELGAGDPKEGFLPWASPNSEQICFAADQFLSDARSWLQGQATKAFEIDRSDFRLDPSFHCDDSGEPQLRAAKVRLEVWYRELRKRRAAWCWRF